MKTKTYNWDDAKKKLDQGHSMKADFWSPSVDAYIKKVDHLYCIIKTNSIEALPDTQANKFKYVIKK